MLEINSFLAIKNQVPSIESPLILPSTYLMVLIMTKAENLELRNTIRQTWLRLSTKTPNLYIHKFVIGMDNIKNHHFIEEEMNKHSDLLLVNLTNESYQNLAKKTLMAFSSVSEQFKFNYLLKVDDDSFVRLGALLNAFKDIEQHPLLYWGFLDGRAKPMRGGKWAENEWRLCDRYLPYQLGGGYILGQKLVNYISKNAHLFQLYRNEDVSVGTWLAGLKVRYVHDPRFDTEWTSRGCNNEYL
uniref:Hexosyltransferase n=1 Tax=Meloidogyne javanica TaxID=6303 RepID=A0A915MPR5_MELJA